MPKVFVTYDIPGSGVATLRKKGYAVTQYAKKPLISRDALINGVKGADAVFCMLTERIDAKVLDAAGPQLKIVANYAVGFDNVDLKAAAERKVVVTNTPSDKVNEAVAEHTFALMLALARRIPEADRYAKAERYQGWNPNLLTGTDLYGKTLGIVGAGRIGAAVARRAVAGFGMQLVYADSRKNEDLEKRYQAVQMSMEKLLAAADVVSLHVPLLPSTRHLISAAQLALMKKTAFLVNTARGPVVDEKALLIALKAKRIAGAALDVFECEPAIDCDIRDNLALKRFPNVILTPHVASATVEAREAMSSIAAENIIAVLSGKPALTPAKV